MILRDCSPEFNNALKCLPAEWDSAEAFARGIETFRQSDDCCLTVQSLNGGSSITKLTGEARFYFFPELYFPEQLDPASSAI